MPDIICLTAAAMAPSTISGIQVRHAWFFAIFLFCGVIVLSNLAHFIIFRVLRHKEKQSKDGRWRSVQQYLSHPARAIFFITCLLIVPIQQNHPTAFPITRLAAISGPLSEAGDHNGRTSEVESPG